MSDPLDLPAFLRRLRTPENIKAAHAVARAVNARADRRTWAPIRPVDPEQHSTGHLDRERRETDHTILVLLRETGPASLGRLSRLTEWDSRRLRASLSRLRAAHKITIQGRTYHPTEGDRP